MPRRVSLPGAAELFRATPSTPRHPADEQHAAAAASPGSPASPAEPAPSNGEPNELTAARQSRRAPRGTGRVRHDEKITVYVSSDELLELERARLQLRAEHGMAVDRGRIVREALALAMGDLAEHGADSDLVRRLSQP
ncbi:hypothetical protein [Microlunatus sp. Gsoil 973]|uniref:hypothetical protein n=1 Tax=Microlunatus sp. Gsoil 973 TaxID=2672569 RepID=UPI0012B45ABD|nr:hypothetical protein [Microlunatus sp. Gsoil 973]QGN33148.1 hypothetical protein GJV80_10370 [Microlunatus sp. Gsoil 973]